MGLWVFWHTHYRASHTQGSIHSLSWPDPLRRLLEPYPGNASPWNEIFFFFFRKAISRWLGGRWHTQSGGQTGGGRPEAFPDDTSTSWGLGDALGQLCWVLGLYLISTLGDSGFVIAFESQAGPELASAEAMVKDCDGKLLNAGAEDPDDKRGSKLSVLP